MIALPMVLSIIALAITLLVVLANGMNESRRGFIGGSVILAAWLLAGLFWLGWWLR